MLAISRALLLNPRLLIMDEPTEGLAPVIVEQVEEILLTLARAGDIGVLVVEQNIGVATAVAEKVAIMINGRVNRIMEAARLEADRELQQRLLASVSTARRSRSRIPTRRRNRRASGAPPNLAVRSGSTFPIRPYRRAGRNRCRLAQIETSGAHAHDSARAGGDRRLRRPSNCGRSIAAASAPVIVAGTLDTKGDELRFIRDQIAAAGVRVFLVDLSTSGKPSPADVPPHHVATYFRGGPNAVFTGERGAAITAMARGVRGLDQAAGTGRRADFGGRIGRQLAGRARRCARCRSACPKCSSRRSPRATSRPMSGPPIS